MAHQTKASQSAAEGKGLEEGITDCKGQFFLTTRDSEGRQCYNERDHVTVEIKDEQGQECITAMQIIDNKDGLYQIRYSPRNEGRCEVTVKVNGEHVRGSQFIVLVKPFQLRPVFCFGDQGSFVGKFNRPWGVAVNGNDEIAKGNKEGELDHPRGIAFHNNGNIFVADGHNYRIQIFSGEGEFVGSFGEKGNLDYQLTNPLGLSVDSEGNVIITDADDKLIKIFSPEGKFLSKLAKKQNIFTKVDDETKRFLKTLTTQKTEIESETNIIEASLEKAGTFLKRSTNAEVVQEKKSFEKIFQEADQSQPQDRFQEMLPVLVFVENSKMVTYKSTYIVYLLMQDKYRHDSFAKLNTINAEEIRTLQLENRTTASQSTADGRGLEEVIANREAHFTLTTRNAEERQCYNEGDYVTAEIMDEQGRDCATDLRITDNKDGLYKISYSSRNEGRCKVTVKVNGEHVRGSQFIVFVKPFQFKPVLSFGESAPSLGEYSSPWEVAVNARDEIAVTDQSGHRVQIFSSEGNSLRSFGKKGQKAGELNNPRGIAFQNNGNIFVADSSNDRIQIFSGEGEYVGSFCGKENLDSQLYNP
ncbi:E3 ubiquitin-protein ligase TRIM71 [Stylophora pistillata]|uniref:E3 ubiquitin-protein ligase TRIM71 n=1 Tax=Stylophora pistillata TaxID=50429 RepID=A0A2B4R7F8_STYPI|nr:E3 ubiquitin-protein ligase TRIM71 [Stylophora pistillata]